MLASPAAVAEATSDAQASPVSTSTQPAAFVLALVSTMPISAAAALHTSNVVIGSNPFELHVPPVILA
jgi:hypothetical protein